MDQSTFLTYCMGKPGAEQSIRQEWQASQIKVGEVMFAMTHEVDGRPAISLKSSPEMAESLRGEYKSLVPCALLNKTHWNTLFLDGDIPDSQFYYLADASWQLAVAALPDALRQELNI
ncbi:MmcQ/YjbR family DNA-binding protein [Sodalis sp. RH21]|uniref:MmcQ/YjbR family DNA-binding protein n=1 Tax=unclassified Sodalis (in: enterobacteria) TaxID=2636512 RepID=UPI0039B40873